MQPNVVLVGLPGLLQDIISAEIRKDPSLKLVPAEEAFACDCVVAVGMADSPLQRTVARLQDATRRVRVIAVSELPVPGDLFRFRITRLASNASASELVAAIRAAAVEPWKEPEASE